MSYQTISEIYATNDSIREKFNLTLETLTDRQASYRPEGEKWSVAQIVEHVSMVESGISRICAKLLSSAETDGQLSDGTVRISDRFIEKSSEIASMKLEAPERVHPTGEVSITESLDSMEESRTKLSELRPLFEEFDGDTHKFPHPFFGDLSAVEWLALVGGHEARHLKQIRTLLEKIG